MRISIDGGALCSQVEDRFGNYIFSQNLIQALAQYANEHHYFVYSFCEKPSWLRKSTSLTYAQSRSSIFWLQGRISIEEIIRQNDIFLALNQSIPLLTPSRIITFSHGLSFCFFRQFYQDSYQELKKQLDTMVKKSQYIIVSSAKVKSEIVSLYRIDTDLIKVLPYGVPFDMLETTHLKAARKKFFLFVGMDHPIKNTDFIISTFENFRKDRKFQDYKLYLVGNFNISNHKNIHCFKSLKRTELAKLYRQAAAYLTASYYESFNLPVLEALSQGCQVIGLTSAIIPELEEYVLTSTNEEEFVKTMKDVAIGKTKRIPFEKLKDQFYWRNYVKELSLLFKSSK